MRPSKMRQVAPAGTVTAPYVPDASVSVHVVAVAAGDETLVASAASSATASTAKVRRMDFLPSTRLLAHVLLRVQRCQLPTGPPGLNTGTEPGSSMRRGEGRLSSALSRLQLSPECPTSGRA